jgi:hypothetical protein
VRPLRTQNLAEEIQDWIAANTTGLSLTYTVGENFILGDALDIQDLDELSGSNVDLTMFEEGSSFVYGGSFVRQDRTFRFVHKGTYGQQAVNRAWELVEWFKNESKTFLSVSGLYSSQSCPPSSQDIGLVYTWPIS